MSYKGLLAILYLSISYFGIAQGTWNWPEDKATAEEKNAIYTDYVKQGSFKEAQAAHYWLLTNAPDLNPSLYINGAKLYKGLADSEKDPARKIILQDSALLMYDLRIKYFQKEAKVINRKAYTAYKYYKGREDKHEELLAILQKAFKLNGNKVYDNNLVAYMDAVRRIQHKTKKFSQDEIFAMYDEVSAIIKYKIGANSQKAEKLKGYQDTIDKMLTDMIGEVDCAFIDDKLGPKLDADPTDVNLAKKIVQLSLAGKCSDSPLFLQAAKIVHKGEPTHGMAKVIALKCEASKDYDCALSFFSEAAELGETNVEKAEMYMEIGDLYAKRGNKSKAREYYLKTANTDPSMKKAYSQIGYLYFKSYDDCKQGVSRVDDRAVFIAAYEMFKRGGNSSGMNNAKEQFPSMEEIFSEGKELGQSVKVGCWIGETVTIQKR